MTGICRLLIWLHTPTDYTRELEITFQVRLMIKFQRTGPWETDGKNPVTWIYTLTTKRKHNLEEIKV